MIKSVIKKILDLKFIENRLIDYYGVKNLGLSEKQIETCMINRQIWYFSKMKTGTTFICNTLAFYNAEINKLDNVDFNNIALGGIGRGVGTNENVLRDLLQFQLITCKNVLIHTHESRPNATPQILILSTRNALDYAVSNFFFHFKNRTLRENVSVDDALPKIIHGYCNTHKAQLEAHSRIEKTLFIKYEDLMENQFTVLNNIIQKIYKSCDHKALKKAISRASMQSLKSFEDKQGFATIAPKAVFKERHFVRSGKIGEGENFFTSKQKDFIKKQLEKAKITLEGNFNY